MQVARREDPRLAELMERFVCIRVVEMEGVNLRRYRFDFDQTWSVMFLHGDGTVYGRYGSRDAAKTEATRLVSLEGFVRTLEKVLELHADPDRHRAALAGKGTGPAAFDRPEEIPWVQERVIGEQKCIHCHHVAAGEIMEIRRRGEPLPDRELFPYPLPANVGLHLDPATCVRVSGVDAGSAAAAAGFLPGDEVLRMDGQVMISLADMQWVLHHAEPGEELACVVRRGGEERALALRLPEGFRVADLSWRETVWTLRPGIWCVPADRGLRIKWVFPRGAAGAAGFQAGDVLVEVAGEPAPRTELEFLRYVLQQCKAGDLLPVTIERDGALLELQLPLPD